MALLALSILAFLGALPLTAFIQAKADEPFVYSRHLLLLGSIGLVFGYVEWLANPLLLWSWIASYFNRPRASGLAAICAFGFELMFLRRHYISWDPGSGRTVFISSLGPGYWLWLVSTCIMIIANADELIKGLTGRPPARA